MWPASEGKGSLLSPFLQFSIGDDEATADGEDAQESINDLANILSGLADELDPIEMLRRRHDLPRQLQAIVGRGFGLSNRVQQTGEFPERMEKLFALFSVDGKRSVVDGGQEFSIPKPS
jgi:hypothetical protein